MSYRLVPPSRGKLTSVLQGVTPVKSFTYDAAGRTTAISESGVVTNFAYDYEDRITQITRSGMTTNTFSYNGFGARVSAVDSSGTRTFARNGTGVTAPVLGDGMANYTPGISERRGGVTRYQSSDIKNATAQVSSSQTVVGAKQYDAFGNLTSSSGSWNGPFSYGGAFGYQSETDTGYQLLGHRYYDPTTGRFLTRDPIGDGRNWYAYCENNPITAADPSGLIDQSPPSPGVVDPLPEDPRPLDGYIYAGKVAGTALLTDRIPGARAKRSGRPRR